MTKPTTSELVKPGKCRYAKVLNAQRLTLQFYEFYGYVEKKKQIKIIEIPIAL